VAGSVVGQWGANWGPGGQGNARLGPQMMNQRARGSRGGKKIREKKEELVKDKIMILTKDKPDMGDDVVVES